MNDASRNAMNTSILPITTNNKISAPSTLLASTPLWIIAITIIFSVFSLGSIITSIVAFIYWKRQKNQTRKAYISTTNNLNAFSSP